jgi:SAM-dependent methyltransferase
MGGEMSRGTGAVERYFSHVYPQGSRVAGIPLFRRGEGHRVQVVRRWVPRWDGLAVLDAGCGDGAFVEKAMAGRPARLRLEDISGVQLQRAAERLARRADRVEAEVADVCGRDLGGGFDVVLALGVSDYVADWGRLVGALLARSAGMVIVDFSRRGRPHHLLRRCWLWLHGVRLYTASRAELDAVLANCGAHAEVEQLPLQWVVRLQPASSPPTT